MISMTSSSCTVRQTDLKNAGARWVDEEVVVDDYLVTSCKPTDIPAFNKKMLERIEQGNGAARGEHPISNRFR
jgi:protease I